MKAGASSQGGSEKKFVRKGYCAGGVGQSTPCHVIPGVALRMSSVEHNELVR